MSDGRTLSEEQETVTAAVISVMHALVDIASDGSIDPEYRIAASCHVLGYATETDPPGEHLDKSDKLESEEEDGQSSTAEH